VSKDIFQEIGASLGLDSTTLDNAYAIYLRHLATKPQSTPTNTPAAVRCAVLIAYKSAALTLPTRDSQLSVSKLLGSGDTYACILQLKDFIRKGLVNEAASRDLQSLINVFAFCMTFYAKFEELWAKLEVIDHSHRPEALKELKQVTWLVFILARVNLCQKRTEVVECACMLVAALNFLVSYLPTNCSCICTNSAANSRRSPLASLGQEPYTGDGTAGHSLKQLCGLLKVTPEQAQFPYDHVVSMMKKFKSRGMLRGDAEDEALEGVLSPCHLGFNIMNLSALYDQTLQLEDIDEREFFNMRMVTKSKAITPFAKHGRPLEHRHSRLSLESEEGRDSSPLSLTSKLEDIRVGPMQSPCIEATPMTLALEINQWFVNFTDDVSLDDFSATLKSYFAADDVGSAIQSRLDHMKVHLARVFDDCNIKTVSDNLSFLEQHFEAAPVAPTAPPVNEKLMSVLRLYLKSLEGMLGHEKSKLDQASFTAILQKSAFHQALYACCLETVFFVHNISVLTFEQVLKVCDISAFEFWKLIDSFAKFDPRMPLRLKLHFKKLEVKIVSELGWERNSPIHYYLRKVIEGSLGLDASRGLSTELNLKSYDIFFRRVLGHAAHRILELSNHLGLAEIAREEVWTALKYALSDQTELMIDRHLDQVILCTVYSVCRVNQAKQASFKLIREHYTELYSEESSKVLNFVSLDRDSSGDIIKFYNQVYIQAMKHYLTKDVPTFRPRISALNPPSPLKASLLGPVHYSSISSPLKSQSSRKSERTPSMTPRTAKLYAFGESPSRNLESINQLITPHRIDFDSVASSLEQPRKKSGYMKEIME
jgi:retinoblastoma-associated protein